jgi:hypothetical protein
MWRWEPGHDYLHEDRPLCFTVECLPCEHAYHWTIPALECDGTSSSAMLPVDAQRACAGIMPWFLWPFSDFEPPTGLTVRAILDALLEAAPR